jgi:SAM-dependent MidA family methyltransferase
MGRPPRLSLVELGPGRGTLMADALRAAQVLPEYRAALGLHLVETSPMLRARQSASLADCGLPIAWHERIDEVPAGPTVVIANEFFDALPIRQFMRQAKGWHERLIGLGEDGSLAFGLSPEAEPSLDLVAAEGAILEISPEGVALAGALARRLAADGGAALIVDYGHVRRGFGDTLQAVEAHGFADPLASPGEADLTAHVDFAALGEAARKEGAALHGPVTQGDYLRALGIDTRARRLKSAATPKQATAVDAALARLAGEGEGEMGALFKAMAIADPRLASLAAFETVGRRLA